MMGLHDLLARKLSEATETPWDPDRPTRVELVEDGARIGLRFLAMKRTGEWVMVHEEPPSPWRPRRTRTTCSRAACRSS